VCPTPLARPPREITRGCRQCSQGTIGGSSPTASRGTLWGRTGWGSWGLSPPHPGLKRPARWEAEGIKAGEGETDGKGIAANTRSRETRTIPKEMAFWKGENQSRNQKTKRQSPGQGRKAKKRGLANMMLTANRPQERHCSVVGVFSRPSSISSQTERARSAATQENQRLRPAQGKVD